MAGLSLLSVAFLAAEVWSLRTEKSAISNPRGVAVAMENQEKLFQARNSVVNFERFTANAWSTALCDNRLHPRDMDSTSLDVAFAYQGLAHSFRHRFDGQMEFARNAIQSSDDLHLKNASEGLLQVIEQEMATTQLLANKAMQTVVCSTYQPLTAPNGEDMLWSLVHLMQAADQQRDLNQRLMGKNERYERIRYALGDSMTTLNGLIYTLKVETLATWKDALCQGSNTPIQSDLEEQIELAKQAQRDWEDEMSMFFDECLFGNCLAAYQVDAISEAYQRKTNVTEQFSKLC